MTTITHLLREFYCRKNSQHRSNQARAQLAKTPYRCRKITPRVNIQRFDLADLGSPHHALIRVYDEAGRVIDTHEQAGEFKEW